MRSEQPSKLLRQKIEELKELLNKGIFHSSEAYHYYFRRWYAKAEYALSQVFGEDSKQLKRLADAANLPPLTGTPDQLSRHRRKAMLRTEAELEAILSSIEEYGIPEKHEGAIPPKAFIAHEGETRALTTLKEFLEALGIQYFIAESKASDGRSIEKQVDWTQSEADFAVCLATKGKAINKKTGKHYMAPNIIDELGRARQVFGNKIILLVQKGVEVHTNVGEIVHETFTTTNMERAFIKITKELRNWGFIRVGKPKE
jgi:hypothetical protein